MVVARQHREVVVEEPLLDEALNQLERCRAAVETLRAEKDVFGTSLSLTILSYRLLVQIERLDVLLHLTEPVERDFQSCAVRLFKTLVRAVNTRNHVIPYVRESADLLAYQVVEFGPPLCAGRQEVEKIVDVLDSLTDRERRVLSLRFGLQDGYSRTLEEVGRQFKVTRERIRQIEAKALRKLKHPSRSRKLRSFLDN